MKFNNIASIIVSVLFASAVLCMVIGGHNKRIIATEQTNWGYNITYVDGKDTCNLYNASYAEYEYLSRTGSIR